MAKMKAINLKKLTENQSEILKAYIEIVGEKKMRPTNADFLAFGISRDRIARSFGNKEILRKSAKKLHPEVFKDIMDEDIFSPRVFKRTLAEISKYSTFVITTVVQGCRVDAEALESIDHFCKKNKALPLFLIAADPAANTGWDTDPILKGRHIIFDDLALNSNLYISTIKLSAKHIDPITGLGRLGQRNGSFIYASPKQRLKMVPTSNVKPPVALMTTGAITLPNYNTDRYMSERTAYIADNDHVMGAIVIEIKDNKKFFFRQIQFAQDGSFVDLGVMYDGGSSFAYRPDSFVLGDYHSGETDPMAERCWMEVIDALKPRRIVFHDLFNGFSISHHEEKSKIELAKRANAGKLNLRDEIHDVALNLNKYTAKVDQCVVVESNHDEFLDRYLQEARYIHDPHNLEYALELSLAMVRGKDPLQYGVMNSGLRNPDKVRWLSRDEDFKVARVEMGAHGDQGANGARGSLLAMENAYGNSISGHAHTPEILRGCYQVGTSSYLKVSYNEGPSSWRHASCLLYPNGMRQMVVIVDGEWRLKRRTA